jgi:hypothetical protein
MMPQPAETVTRSSWRDRYPVHPCADVFPMLSEPELDALAADIKANSLRSPIVLWQDETASCYWVLDGRNRLEALERLGVAIPDDPQEAVDIPRNPREGEDPSDATVYCRIFILANDGVQIDDPARFVISLNITRRHLTKEQQAILIVQTLEAGRIDCANLARSFSPVAGAKGGSTKDLVLAEAVAEAEKYGISRRTVQNARAKVRGTRGRRATPEEKRAYERARSTVEALRFDLELAFEDEDGLQIDAQEIWRHLDELDEKKIWFVDGNNDDKKAAWELLDYASRDVCLEAEIGAKLLQRVPPRPPPEPISLSSEDILNFLITLLTRDGFWETCEASMRQAICLLRDLANDGTVSYSEDDQVFAAARRWTRRHEAEAEALERRIDAADQADHVFRDLVQQCVDSVRSHVE